MISVEADLPILLSERALEDNRNYIRSSKHAAVLLCGIVNYYWLAAMAATARVASRSSSRTDVKRNQDSSGVE